MVGHVADDNLFRCLIKKEVETKAMSLVSARPFLKVPLQFASLAVKCHEVSPLLLSGARASESTGFLKP